MARTESTLGQTCTNHPADPYVVETQDAEHTQTTMLALMWILFGSHTIKKPDMYKTPMRNLMWSLC